jgi:hypothetical protein
MFVRITPTHCTLATPSKLPERYIDSSMVLGNSSAPNCRNPSFEFSRQYADYINNIIVPEIARTATGQGPVWQPFQRTEILIVIKVTHSHPGPATPSSSPQPAGWAQSSQTENQGRWHNPTKT